MPNTKCCVPGCLNSYPKAPEGTTWHPFPKNENLAKKWIEIIGENFEKEKRNSLICSDHFNEKDFKTSSYCTRRKSRILSSSAVPSIFKENINNQTIADQRAAKWFSNVKKQSLSSTIEQENFNTETHIFVLLSDVWENILAYLSSNDVKALTSTCEFLQKSVQKIVKKLDFSNNYRLDITSLLNYTLSTTCTSLNLNHCYWLKSKEILEIIHKTNLKHLHIIECKVNSKCIKAIRKLKLTSLSISYESIWKLFFNKQNAKNSFRGFRDLKNLELFYKKSPSDIIMEMYAKVLVHCKELEHFKVFQCVSQSICDCYNSNVLLPHQTSLVSTFVPKLKSLVINLQNVWDDHNVARLIALIMKDKVIPLQHADFGHQTGFLYRTNILPDPKIISDKSKLSISCINTDFNFWLNLSPIKKLFSQPDYKIVEIHNVKGNGFYQFSQKIVSNSGKSLEKILIKHHKNFYNDCPQFLDGLSHIVINCPQITVFDITGLTFLPRQQFSYISNETVRKHKTLLNAFANLKNLKKLVITPDILHCKYLKSKGEKREKALPFWKVTSACKNLIELRIGFSNPNGHCQNYHVHEDSLYDIGLCTNLQTLHLARFQIHSGTQFSLSRITHSCGQLQELFICDIGKLSDDNYIFSKNIKIMSTSEIITCDKKFLDNLSQCKNLEKLYVNGMSIGVGHYKLLADVLRKLNNLMAFVSRSPPLHLFPNTRWDIGMEKARNKLLENQLKSIVDAKPAFYYSVKGFHHNQTPAVHLDSLYYNGINDEHIENAL